MIRSYERQASFKYLTGRGGRFLSLSALFSLLGIAVGVAALIIASAFLNGQVRPPPVGFGRLGSKKYSLYDFTIKNVSLGPR